MIAPDRYSPMLQKKNSQYETWLAQVHTDSPCQLDTPGGTYKPASGSPGLRV